MLVGGSSGGKEREGKQGVRQQIWIHMGIWMCKRIHLVTHQIQDVDKEQA
jgi:hypothetical protein